MTSERTFYRERTHWPGWVHAVMWGSLVLSCYPILAGWDTDMPFEVRVWIAAAIMSFGGLLYWAVGGLTVVVKDTRLVASLGTAGFVRKTVHYVDIETLESVRYRPIREFGGWGVRGFGAKQAWTARGDQAVVLTLKNGKQLYIGSDHPRRLEERIRAAAGDLIGSPP